MSTSPAPRTLSATRTLSTTGIPSTTGPTAGTPSTNVSGVATIAAPVLLATGSVVWAVTGEAGTTTAALQLWAMAAFAIGVPTTLIGRLDDVAPTARAALGSLFLIGCAAGAAFAGEIAVADVRGVERIVSTGLPQVTLMLNLPGIVFPLSLLASAITCARKGVLSARAAAVIGVGAVLFPLARIPELGAVAVVGDVTLALGLVPLGLAALRGRSSTRPGTATTRA